MEAIAQAEPPVDLLAEIRRRRLARLASKSTAYARSIPIASDCDPGSCLRRQVLEIVAWQDKPLPDADRQARFEAGTRSEGDVIIDLRECGFAVEQEQVPFELRHRRTGEPCLRGRIDGKIAWQSEGGVPFEAKSLHPHIFAGINTADDWARYWWTRRYPPQLQAYLVGHAHPWGFWILTDLLGNWKLMRTDLDYSLAERIWTFAESILDGVRIYRADGALPSFTTDPTECAHCPFFGRTCQPPIAELGARMLADPELEALVGRWAELRTAHREYEATDRRVKETLRTALPERPLARGVIGSRFAVVIKDKPVKAEAKPRPARVDRLVEIETLGDGAQP